MNNLSVLGQNVFVLYEKLCRVVKGGPSVLIPPLAHVGILQALNDDVGHCGQIGTLKLVMGRFR